MDLLEGFLDRVEKTATCWLWVGRREKQGYGKMVVRGRGKDVKAHRLAWELFVGPIPDGLCVCHRCDEPSCVNPGHLFLGTHAENMADMVKKKRQASADRNRGGRPGGRLSVALVKEAKLRFSAGGVSKRGLAKKFGVSSSVMIRALNGENWKGV